MDKEDEDFFRVEVAKVIAWNFLYAVPGGMTAHDLKQRCEVCAAQVMKLIELKDT